MLNAKRSKAHRGESRFSVPFDYIWHREVGLGLEPNLRLQEVIRLMFSRFRELSSARLVLLSPRAEQLHFPRPSGGRTFSHVDWIPVRYRNVISVLENQFYAGAYVYDKSGKQTAIVDGGAQKLQASQAIRGMGHPVQGAP
jgi:hypothetical protein